MQVRKRYLAYFIALVIGALTFISHQDPDKATVDILRTYPPETIIPMESFLKGKRNTKSVSGDLHLVILQGGLKTVFRPFLSKQNHSPIAEVCAYKASKFLGFPYVPPSTIRSINGRTGTIQVFEKSCIDGIYCQKKFNQLLSQADPEDIANLQIFYFLFGNWSKAEPSIIPQYRGNRIRLCSVGHETITFPQYTKYNDFPFVAIAQLPKIATPFRNRSAFPFNERHTLHDIKRHFRRHAPSYPIHIDQTIRSFARIDPSEDFIVYDNVLWKKCHCSLLENQPNAPKVFPKDSMNALKRLDYKALKKIFHDAKKEPFYSKQYLKNILARRDLILEAYEKYLDDRA